MLLLDKQTLLLDGNIQLLTIENHFMQFISSGIWYRFYGKDLILKEYSQHQVIVVGKIEHIEVVYE